MSENRAANWRVINPEAIGDPDQTPVVEWQSLAESRDQCTCWPHAADEACTCDGCSVCSGAVVGCTCDIAWDCEHGR